MPLVTIELDLASLAYPNAANRKLFGFQSRDKAQVRAVYANGASAGPQVTVEVPTAKLVETHGHGSSPKITAAPAMAKVTLDAGAGASHAQILFKGKYSFVPLPSSKQAAWPLPELRTVYKGSDPQWKLVVIAELYRPGTQEKFFQHCRDLAEHVKDSPPFNHPEVAKRIQVDGYFIPSPPEGLFACTKETERRIYGDFKLVQQFIAARGIKLRKNDMVLVLMNLPWRGGAGERDDENIAWATPVSLFFGQGAQQVLQEDWRDVAMHEIGHAFELDDEYEDAWAGAPLTMQANVTSNADYQAAPWQALFTSRPPPVLLSDQRVLPPNDWSRDWATDDEIRDWSGKIGMFEGARYNSDGYWRSSLLCKMRLTRDKFCPQCQAIIKKAILTNG
jgi:IgA Peptidase M64